MSFGASGLGGLIVDVSRPPVEQPEDGPAAGPVITGCAGDDSSATVVVGGQEVRVGGWVDTALDQRSARFESERLGGAPAGGCYSSKTHVQAEDVLGSLYPAAGGNGRRLGDPLSGGSAGRGPAPLEAQIKAGRLPALDGEAYVHPELNSEDLRQVRYDRPEMPVSLWQKSQEVRRGVPGLGGAPPRHDGRAVRGAEGRQIAPPPSIELPRRTVPVANRMEVERLETDLRGAAQALEQYRGHVAEVFEEAAEAIERFTAGRAGEAKKGGRAGRPGGTGLNCRWPPLGKAGGGSKRAAKTGRSSPKPPAVGSWPPCPLDRRPPR